MPAPRICLLGLENLSVLRPEFSREPAAGEPVQQTLLARALVRRGFEVSMVVADLGQPDQAVYDGITAYRTFRPDAGIPVLRFLHPRWTSVMAALRRAQADVYYTSCAGTHVAQIVRAAAAVGARSVFRIASDSDCDPRRLLIRFWRDRKIYEYGLARVHRVLAQSAQQQAAMRRNYGRDSTVASMLVEPAREVRGFEQRESHLLWVSNIRSVKRPDRMLELARALPGLRARMVGGAVPGSEALYSQIESEAHGIALLDFAGPMPFDEVPAAFAAARVFINTSDVEGFPNSYLQAWIHGVPVVAYFDPDGVIARRGLGYAVRTPDELKSAALHLATDEAAWRAASERCLRYMADEFGEERILAPYLEAFGAPQSLARSAG